VADDSGKATREKNAALVILAMAEKVGHFLGTADTILPQLKALGSEIPPYLNEDSSRRTLVDNDHVTRQELSLSAKAYIIIQIQKIKPGDDVVALWRKQLHGIVNELPALNVGRRTLSLIF
jgi:hypothetical protein